MFYLLVQQYVEREIRTSEHVVSQCIINFARLMYY